MNKYLTKVLARNSGLTVAEDMIIEKNSKIDFNKIIKTLKFPIIIKPNTSGSSVGMSIAKNTGELKAGVNLVLNLGQSVLLEKFIRGRELTCAVFGNKEPRALPIIEIVPKISGWYDYKAKYLPQGSAHICPAKVPEKINKKVQTDSVKIFTSLGCRDLARADFIWNEPENKIYFLEINTIPGMTAQSLTPEMAKASGLDFKDFIQELIVQALKR
jgi:D-alanine-D-alanine ligase